MKKNRRIEGKWIRKLMMASFVTGFCVTQLPAGVFAEAACDMEMISDTDAAVNTEALSDTKTEDVGFEEVTLTSESTETVQLQETATVTSEVTTTNGDSTGSASSGTADGATDTVSETSDAAGEISEKNDEYMDAESTSDISTNDVSANDASANDGSTNDGSVQPEIVNLEVSYSCGSGEDLSIAISLNGFVVQEVKLDDKTLSDVTDYKILDDGTLVISKEYLDDLAAGDYVIMISFSTSEEQDIVYRDLKLAVSADASQAVEQTENDDTSVTENNSASEKSSKTSKSSGTSDSSDKKSNSAEKSSSGKKSGSGHSSSGKSSGTGHNSSGKSSGSGHSSSGKSGSSHSSSGKGGGSGHTSSGKGNKSHGKSGSASGKSRGSSGTKDKRKSEQPDSAKTVSEEEGIQHLKDLSGRYLALTDLVEDIELPAESQTKTSKDHQSETAGSQSDVATEPQTKTAEQALLLGFTHDLAALVIDGESGMISGVGEDGGEIFSYQYEFTGYDQETGFYEYRAIDEDAGDYAWFLFSEDTAMDSYHIEFRFGSDEAAKNESSQNESAVWIACGISIDETMTEEEMKKAAETSAAWIQEHGLTVITGLDKSETSYRS